MDKGFFSPSGIERPVREVDHSSESNIEVKDEFI
jgi:hypothetical protein